MSDPPELEFFNTIGGQLNIELTEPAEKISPNLDNEAAPASAKIVSLQLKAEIFVEEKESFRDLTPEELASVALRQARIRMRGEDGEGVVSHDAPNGESFTVQELLQAVEETERQTRGNSEWFGGVDVHHCFFEGIHLGEDGVWEISWGS